MVEIELVKTNYSHPTITTGQHTNGPGRVWLREGDRWMDTGSSSLLRVRQELARNGTERIEAGTWQENS